jgi:hypothetical protein
MITTTPRTNLRYTFQRNSLYYFRYTLPPDFSKLVGKTGLRYSLRTGYIKQAESKARRLAGTVEDFISEIRYEHHMVMNLSTDKLQSLLDQHLRKALDDDEDRRLSSGPMNSDDVSEELETISYVKSEWYGFQWSRYMRIGPSEKLEIIRIVEESELSARKILIELGGRLRLVLSVVDSG